LAALPMIWLMRKWRESASDLICAGLLPRFMPGDALICGGNATPFGIAMALVVTGSTERQKPNL
jgi:hypothetical protein